MSTTPQEGGGDDPRSVIQLGLEGADIEAVEWTNGAVTFRFILTTKSSRYRVAMSLSELMLLDIKIMEVLIGALRKQREGK